MKNLKYFILVVATLFSCLVIFVYTWDIPSPQKKITKIIEINDEVTE